MDFWSTRNTASSEPVGRERRAVSTYVDQVIRTVAGDEPGAASQSYDAFRPTFFHDPAQNHRLKISHLGVDRHDDSKVWHKAGNRWSKEPRFPHGPRDRLAAGRTALDERKSVDMFYNVEYGGGNKSGMACAAMKNLRGTSCKTRADRFPPKGKSLSGQTTSAVGPGTYKTEDMRSWNRDAGASQYQFNSKVERRLADGRKDYETELVEPEVKLAPGQAPPIEVILPFYSFIFLLRHLWCCLYRRPAVA
jgi:hypothetical protein